MSRAFTNEDADVGEVMIPPRAPLPPGAINYVTPFGRQLLEDEQAALDAEKAALSSGDKQNHDRIRQLTIINGKLRLLGERLSSARVIEPATQPTEEVRFGARVRVAFLDGPMEGKEQDIRIVGVDESGHTPERIAFTAPIARALTGARVGHTVKLAPEHGNRSFRIVGISYDDA
ncbi:MAG: GreA/GreB family elongation factor [Rhodothermales bacterium]